jgi:hypothetical protein
LPGTGRSAISAAPGQLFDRSKPPERAEGVINTAFAVEERPLNCFFAVPGEN